MEKIRYFRSANQFNIATNLLSGNIFPLSDEKINLSFVSFLWVIFVWFVNITYVLTVTSGSLYFAKLTTQESLKRSGAIIALYIELAIPLIYLNLRRNDLRNLISKYNVILIDSSDLRTFIRDTVRPYKRGLKIYTIACFIVTSAWKAEPLLKIFDNHEFTYADFTVPAYLPGEPFGTKVFVVGVILQILGACFINLGKISVDVYVSYFIAILSAEYKYLRAQVANALNHENDQEDELSVMRALQNCVRHHGAVIECRSLMDHLGPRLCEHIECGYAKQRYYVSSGEFHKEDHIDGIHKRIKRFFFRTGQKLAEMLAFHIGATYITCILKFCFLAFGIVAFESANVEKASYLVYAFACVVQIFLLCSCIQELFDESTSVTHDAFHGNWHTRNSAVKRIFCMMEMSNQMQCRLSAYGIVELVVPTLAVILSKSYSFSLLLLKIN